MKLWTLELLVGGVCDRRRFLRRVGHLVELGNFGWGLGKVGFKRLGMGVDWLITKVLLHVLLHHLVLGVAGCMRRVMLALMCAHFISFLWCVRWCVSRAVHALRAMYASHGTHALRAGHALCVVLCRLIVVLSA